MKTLALFSGPKVSIPVTTAWYLSSIERFHGKQEFYTRQSPQRLQVLREHAVIESAVSSNRIEGVAIETSRVQSVLIAAKPLLRDRDEEEVRGYRDALAWIHEQSSGIAVSEASLKQLHSLTRGQIWDAGLRKRQHTDGIELQVMHCR